MSEIDEVLQRAEVVGDLDDPDLATMRADLVALAAEVRRLRAELQAQSDMSIEEALDHFARLFPTTAAKRIAAKHAEQRSGGTTPEE
jgi:hypothetical protein